MAVIAIRGIRIKTLTFTAKPDVNEEKVSATYELISTQDKVLAEQSLGGYNGMKVSMSPSTHKALDDFLKAYRNDINLVLGLDTET